jgi:hypothetical protein
MRKSSASNPEARVLPERTHATYESVTAQAAADVLFARVKEAKPSALTAFQGHR